MINLEGFDIDNIPMMIKNHMKIFSFMTFHINL